MDDSLGQVIADWTRLGVLYSERSARRTPDIETLLLRTAERLPRFARLLPTTVTWLVAFERLVCRHRLARAASPASGHHRPAVRRRGARHHLDDARGVPEPDA